MKKWWIGFAIALIVLPGIIWRLWPKPHRIRVVSHDPSFVIYDFQYYAQTNRIYYWRAAWRDALGLIGFKKRGQGKRGPALVIYHSAPRNPPMFALFGTGSLNSCDAEYFGNRCVTKFYCQLTNGQYHIVDFGSPSGTNIADVYVTK